MKNHPLFSRKFIGMRTLALLLCLFLILPGSRQGVSAAQADPASAGETAAAPAAETGTDPAPVGETGTASPAGETGTAPAPAAGTETQEADTAGWPAAPFVHAPAAILVEMESGAVLYGKNIHERHFPASITKLLTALIAYENLGLEDTISATDETTDGLPWDSSMAGFEKGQTFTVKDVLYGLMVSSGNDAANMLAEKTAGSKKKFPKLMNERAEELGCHDSHFANAHGIHDPDHYTSVYDMAQIARAYFSYEDLSRIAGADSYTARSEEGKKTEVYSKNKLIQGKIHLEGLVGSKTGYTDMARETLATCAEQNGMKLICIVMRDEPDNHYTDTLNLLKYGFENFKKVDIGSIKTDVISTEERFMTEGDDLIGSSMSPMTLRSGSFLVIPADGSESFITAKVADKSEYVNIRNVLKKPTEGQIKEEKEEETGKKKKKKAEKKKEEEKEENTQETQEETEDQKEEETEKVLGAVRYLYGVNVVGYADVVYLPGTVSQTGSAETEKNGIIHAGRSGSFYIFLPGFLIGISVLTLIAVVILMVRAHKKYLVRKSSRKGQGPGGSQGKPPVRIVQRTQPSSRNRKRPE
jgi:D-alanyl-D-alanine carboxypeptidase